MKNETVEVTGGCLCGRIRYEAEVFLKNGYICHCTMCQKSTGQPAEITVPIKAGTLKYVEANRSSTLHPRMESAGSVRNVGLGLYGRPLAPKMIG